MNFDGDKKVTNTIKLHISQLKMGMFVADIDCGWLKTPYAVQGVMINNLGDIEKLSKYATFVWVDPVKSTINASALLKQLKTKEVRSSQAVAEALASAEDIRLEKRRVAYDKTASIKEEHPVAYALYEKGKQDVKSIISDVTMVGSFDLNLAKDLVNENVQSILRNPDALMWMSKIREVDEYTAEHCLNVSILAMVFGRHLGLKEADLVKVGLAGLLHDLGKLQVPSHILNKPGQLTEEEALVMSQHPRMGFDMLKNAKSLPKVVASTALSHHERIDSKGYPAGQPAMELSEIVRLVSIVDTYDAITSERCYSKPKSTTTALKIIYDEKGKQFDEQLVLEFIRCIGIYPPGILVELLNGSVGLVIEINEGFRHLPKILLLRVNEQVLDQPRLINLIEVESGLLANEYLVKRTLSQGTHGIFTKDYTHKLA